MRDYCLKFQATKIPKCGAWSQAKEKISSRFLQWVGGEGALCGEQMIGFVVIVVGTKKASILLKSC